MNISFRASNFAVDSRFVALLALTWTSYFMLTDVMLGLSSADLVDNGYKVLFALGASMVSSFLLLVLGYFDPFRLFPRKSDIFLVMVAVPVGALVQYEFLRLAFGISAYPVMTILLSTPILTFVIFGGHFFFSRLLLRVGHTKKVVLHLLPEEDRALRNEFKELLLENSVEFISFNDLKKLFLEGRARDVKMIVISRESTKQFDVDATLIKAHLAGIPVVDNRKMIMDLSGRIDLEDSDLWTFLMAATPQTVPLRVYSTIKVFIEPLIAVALGVLLAPVMALLAILIRATSKGPIFYTQVRTGYLGRTFTLVKFRSMIANSEANGPQWSPDNDNRITPLGKFMRKTRLDELPQLWNVLKGEMSFVGPRPERPEIYSRLKKEVPLFSMRTIVRPGITGWAQVCAGYAASIQESKLKLEYDLYYIQHTSPRLDLVVLAKTLHVAIFGSERIIVAEPIVDSQPATLEVTSLQIPQPAVNIAPSQAEAAAAEIQVAVQ